MEPVGKSLRYLWRMATGKVRQRRFEMAELASLVWGMGDIDLEKYLYYGIMEETGKGGPLELRPELEAQVEAEVERIRAENPDLPRLGGRR